MLSASPLLLLLFLSFSACGQAQTVPTDTFPASHWTWAWIPESDQSSYGRAITTDQGGAYVTGFFDGGFYARYRTARFGPYDLPLRGEMNFFLVRLDTLGHVVWARGYGDAGVVSASSMARGPQGALFIVGRLAPGIMSGEQGRWDVNPRPLVSSEDRAFLARLDTTGAVQWGQLIDGMASAESVAVDGAGNVYVGGSAGVHPSLGTLGNAILASFSADGDLRWNRTVSKGKSATAQGLATTSYGVCVAGYTQEAVEAPNASLSGFIVGYDSDGELLSKQVLAPDSSSQGLEGSVYLHGAASDASDACYVAGGFAGVLSFGGTWLASHDDPRQVSAHAHTDAVVLKVDNQGEPVWAAQLEGGPMSDFAHSVTVELDGQVVSVGTFMGSVRWGADTLSVPLTGGGRPPRALFAGILNLEGSPLGSAQSASNATMSTSRVAAGADGSYYVTGRMEGRVYVARLKW